MDDVVIDVYQCNLRVCSCSSQKIVGNQIKSIYYCFPLHVRRKNGTKCGEMASRQDVHEQMFLNVDDSFFRKSLYVLGLSNCIDRYANILKNNLNVVVQIFVLDRIG